MLVYRTPFKTIAIRGERLAMVLLTVAVLLLSVGYWQARQEAAYWKAVNRNTTYTLRAAMDSIVTTRAERDALQHRLENPYPYRCYRGE